MKNIIQKNVIIIILFIIILLGTVFAGLIYLDYNRVKEIDISNMEINSGDIQFHIDSVNNDLNSNYINIRGWAFKSGSNLSTVECYAGLMKISTKEVYKVNTVKEAREDVTTQFNDGYNYDNSGFFANFSKKKLEKGEYEIILLYLSDNNNIFVPTGETISIP